MRFLRSESGSISILGAFSITVLFVGVAAAFEITSASTAQRALNRSADAAALAGTRAAANAFEDGDAEWAATGRRVAESFWASTVERETRAEIDSSSFNFVKDGETIIGTAEYAGHHSSVLAGLVPGAVSIGDVLSTRINLKTYIDLTFLVDVSASMGIGATSTDQALMQDNNGCAFACHIPKNPGQRVMTPEAARDVGATLRMDVIREAMIDAVRLLADEAGPDEVQVSVYSFDTTFQEVLAPTTDLATAQTALENLDMVDYSPTGPQKIGGTVVKNALEKLEESLEARGNHGDGLSPERRSSYVVFASDGVEHSVWQEKTGTFGNGDDRFGDGTGLPDGWITRSDAHHDISTFYVQPFDSTFCQPLKNDGHTVYSAQIEYISTPDMRGTNRLTSTLDYIDAKDSEIRHSFSSCATVPRLHIAATTPAEISSLFNEIVQSVLASKLRLIN